MQKIPKSHPRYHSLLTRELIAQGMKQGIVHETGLIAHGRGEAFDYLLGETTIPLADDAEKIAAAALLCAKNPVISLNGNVTALAADACISLAKRIPATLEVNLFHRTPKRVEKIVAFLRKKGVKTLYGVHPDARIPGLESDRALCDKKGIFTADVVLIPLEDGDRCQALQRMGKTVIAIDLNPLSRTAQAATITIVDNVTRAVPRIEDWIVSFKHSRQSHLKKLVLTWDNTRNLHQVLSFLSKRLNSLS
ncbi:MAG: phosphopantothenate/pantothenate synthetase [Candidatus Thermoplasmatota archaeon]|nr:phosphopantothenate/pantothenate synthetase [Candidatus Thermoplasmatota archaeon]